MHVHRAPPCRRSEELPALGLCKRHSSNEVHSVGHEVLTVSHFTRESASVGDPDGVGCVAVLGVVSTFAEVKQTAESIHPREGRECP